MDAGTLARSLAQKLAALRMRASPDYRVTFAGRDVTFGTLSTYEARWFKRNLFNGNHRHFHEPVLTTVLERLADRFPGVLDLGAHIGYFSVLMASVPGQRVVAVELDPTNFRLLSEQVAGQPEDIRARLTLVHAGVAGADGHVPMPAARAPSPMHRIGEGTAQATAEGTADGSTVEVALVTIDRLISSHDIAPSIVKMDVEGHELLALGAAQRLLREVRPVIALEIHPRFLAELGSTPAEVVALMHGLDYTMFTMDERRPRDLSKLSEATAFAFEDTSDVLFVPAERDEALAIVRAVG